MKRLYIYPLVLLNLLISCDNPSEKPSASHETDKLSGEAHSQTNEEGTAGRLYLTHEKFQRLEIKVDTMPVHSFSEKVTVNGQLEVPPQHEATVTAILGANVTSIEVIEGDKVQKGQLLAYIAHPNLTRLQTGYVKAYSQLQFLEKEQQRQKRLYEEEVGSGKTFQQTQADYQAMKGEANGYEAQLRQLNMNVTRIREGKVYQQVPVVSPIDGYIEKVAVRVGQYADPQKEMFMIVNTEHIHADLMVFEKDIHKVRKGQKITFTVESVPDTRLSAEIYSVGKKFETNPKAIHLHAEIKDKTEYLIPGMYISGTIRTGDKERMALPEGAVIEEEGKFFIFLAEKPGGEAESEWEFRPVEVTTGMKEDEWIEIKKAESLPPDAQVVWNDAYYLISEVKKGQTGHHD